MIRHIRHGKIILPSVTLQNGLYNNCTISVQLKSDVYNIYTKRKCLPGVFSWKPDRLPMLRIKTELRLTVSLENTHGAALCLMLSLRYLEYEWRVIFRYRNSLTGQAIPYFFPREITVPEKSSTSVVFPASASCCMEGFPSGRREPRTFSQ